MNSSLVNVHFKNVINHDTNNNNNSNKNNIVSDKQLKFIS